MSVEREARAREVFDGALDLRGVEREAYLEKACRGDEGLRERVGALLSGAELDDAFLAGATAQPPPPGAFVEEAGARIGAYKLLQAIGEGGFGRVYMAEQERPVRRRVALKIIKLGMDTRTVVARFEQERQALALMDHPNIAKVLDAGATESGRPYFVMSELVKGDPITQYCDRNSVSIPDRLSLFVQVCQALQHAHNKGIIHRDIKPSNVLVATQDGRPHARVIDFGIAKATQHRLTEKTVFTEFRQLIGTLEYMSPEQAEGSLDVDTRTDVYSLGVLLYELLTGATPFDPQRLRSAAYGEVQRIIREDDPPRPSTRLAQSAETLPSVAARRKIEPRKLGLIMRGELDWVVMKALEKERGRRYETPSGLAEDITRFLEGEAVTAAPPSARYRLQKFVRRNRAAVIGGAVVLGALVLGMVGTSIGLIKAQRARAEEQNQAVIARASAAKAADEAKRADKEADAAKKQAVIAQSASDFLTDMLSKADRGEQGGNADVKVREVLDAAAASLSVSKAGYEPEVYEAVLRTLGKTYAAIGLYDEAMRHLNEALRLRTERLGAESLEVAESLSDLVGISVTQELGMQAEPMAERALAIRRKLLGPDHQLVAASISNLALIKWQRRDFAGAQKLHEESLAILARWPGEVRKDKASALDSLGLVLVAKGDARGAVPRHREALALRRELFGAEHPTIASSLNNLGWALLQDNQAEEAIRCYREALAMRIKLIGREHAVTALTMNNLAGTLQAAGRVEEAESLFREAMEIRRKVLGPENSMTISTIGNLASALQDQGKLDEAEALYNESLALRRRMGESADVADTLGNLATLKRDRGDLDGAEKLLREALDIRRKTAGDHPDTALALTSLAVIMATKGNFEGAIPLAQEAVGMRRRLTGPSNREVARALFNLGQMQQAGGDYAASEPTLREAMVQFREFYGAQGSMTLSAAGSLGATLTELAWRKVEAGAAPEHAEEAEALLRTAAGASITKAAPVDVQLAVRRGQLGSAIAVVEAGKGASASPTRLTEAESLLEQAYAVVNSGANPGGTLLAQRRVRDARVRFVRLYTLWERVEPGQGKDAKAAEYRDK